MTTETTQESGTPVQDQETPETQQPVDVQELVKQELAKVQDQFKKEIAGLNRKNSELEKVVEEKELDNLNDKDRSEKELEIARKEKESILAETKTLKRDRVVDKALFDAGLPQDFAKRINGEDQDTISEDVTAFQEFINAEAEKRAEAIINKRLGGEAPEAGAVSDDSYATQHATAMKAGDITTALSIKRRAAAEGVIIQ